jgi:hypothetical protein
MTKTIGDIMRTSPVFAFKPEQCDTGSDGSLTCSGGQGGRTVDGEEVGDPASDCERGTCTGGQGGHLECDIEDTCTSQGGSGEQSDSFGDTSVGGEGHRITGDFSGDGEVPSQVGGSGEHTKGEGNK